MTQTLFLKRGEVKKKMQGGGRSNTKRVLFSSSCNNDIKSRCQVIGEDKSPRLRLGRRKAAQRE